MSTSDLYATPRNVASTLCHCHFYHEMDVPGSDRQRGPHRDLTEMRNTCIGHLDVSGKRVLEIGPASPIHVLLYGVPGAMA